MGIFAKLADNGLSGCRWVVGADARKWGYSHGLLLPAVEFHNYSSWRIPIICSVVTILSSLPLAAVGDPPPFPPTAF